jgi:phosphate transport system substrate-binding protein
VEWITSIHVRYNCQSRAYPITEAVAEEFGHKHPRVRVTVGISGTGGGFKRFVAGETDISDASRPIKKKERDAASAAGIGFIEVPIAYDGLSIVTNKKNTWCNDLTVKELKAIFLAGSTVATWQDIRPEWPPVPVKIYAPGTDSGTFDYFKEVITGKKGSIRADMSVFEDDNVLVRGVAGETGGIGFFGCAYYFENRDKLKALAINGILPTPKTIENGVYAPFSRPLFIYVNAESYSRPEVAAFVRFYLDNAAELAGEVGYVQLPQELYDRAAGNLSNGIIGTQFLDADSHTKHGPLAEIYH